MKNLPSFHIFSIKNDKKRIQYHFDSWIDRAKARLSFEKIITSFKANYDKA